MEWGEISVSQTLAEYAPSGKKRLHHHHPAQPLRARPLRARYTVPSVDGPLARGSRKAAVVLHEFACSSEWVVCLGSFCRSVRLPNPPDAI